MRLQRILYVVILLCLGFNNLHAQLRRYRYLTFAAADINKMNTPGFSYFMFSFEPVVVGNNIFYELSAATFNEDREAMGDAFRLAYLPRNPDFIVLNNIMPGIFKLTKETMEANGMDGQSNWYLKPQRFVEQGITAEYVAYLFSNTVPPSGNVAQRSAIQGATSFVLNPSPPKQLD